MSEAKRKRTIVRVTIPEDLWEPNSALDDPLAGLIGPQLLVNGLSMHLEAWEVRTRQSDGFEVQAATPEFEDDYQELHSAVHADGAFTTLKIGEREYVLVASPFCE